MGETHGTVPTEFGADPRACPREAKRHQDQAIETPKFRSQRTGHSRSTAGQVGSACAFGLAAAGGNGPGGQRRMFSMCSIKGLAHANGLDIFLTFYELDQIRL